MESEYWKLKEQYEWHNVAPPHIEQQCPICIKWKEVNENPLTNVAKY